MYVPVKDSTDRGGGGGRWREICSQKQGPMRHFGGSGSSVQISMLVACQGGGGGGGEMYQTVHDPLVELISAFALISLIRDREKP